ITVYYVFFLFFFFQAEDGIRDFHVTGVQTCALPILSWSASELQYGQQATASTGIELVRRANPKSSLVSSGGSAAWKSAEQDILVSLPSYKCRLATLRTLFVL